MLPALCPSAGRPGAGRGVSHEPLWYLLGPFSEPERESGGLQTVHQGYTAGKDLFSRALMLGTRLGRPTVQKAGLEAKAALLSDCHLPGHSPLAQGGVLAIGAQTGTGQSSTRGNQGNWERLRPACFQGLVKQTGRPRG